MKTLFALALCAFPLLAHAGLDCRDEAAGPDHGFVLTFDANDAHAEVARQSLAGPQALAKLDCEAPKGDDKLKNVPDAMHEMLACSQPGIADGGFGLLVRTGGFAGVTTATLSEESIAGPHDVAHFICKPGR